MSCFLRALIVLCEVEVPEIIVGLNPVFSNEAFGVMMEAPVESSVKDLVESIHVITPEVYIVRLDDGDYVVDYGDYIGGLAVGVHGRH